MHRADFMTGLFLLLIGLIIMSIAWQMPRFTDVGASIYEAPGLVPFVLAACLAILGLLLAAKNFRKSHWRTLVDIPRLQQAFFEHGYHRVLIQLICAVLYVALLGRLHFFLLTSLFVATNIAIFEWSLDKWRGRKAKLSMIAALQGLLVGGLVFIIFTKVFLVRLP